MNPARPGLFITLEGGEGAGKSTAARGLAELFRAEGAETILTREPGGTPGAEAIRALLLGDVPLDALSQTMLHFAARADHAQTILRPALARGAVIICDRYYDSTMAYQSYGQGVPIEAVAALIRLVDLHPDVTFLLDLPPAMAEARLRARASGSDRYEAMGHDFMARVARGFHSIAAAAPGRIAVIDATQTPEAVVAAMRAAIRARAGR
jgi:dTMP kinase